MNYSSSNLPNFLVVGAMKAGTSTLAHYLRQHPQIYMPKIELHFFDKEGNFEKGVDWYKEQFQQAEERQILGEKTPTYSYLPECPERIAGVVPEVKVVWIFRNPIDRAYSNYWHAVNAGVERLSFKEAIEQEENRKGKNIWFGYKKRSKYIEQVNRYLEFFSREDMCFLFFEELLEEREVELNRIYEFLDISPHSPEPAQKNKTYIPSSILLQYYSKKLFGQGKTFNYFSRLNHLFKTEYPKMDEEVRAKLRNYFEPYNKSLFKLIGRKTEDWN